MARTALAFERGHNCLLLLLFQCSTHLAYIQVEGWQLPPALIKRAHVQGRGLRFSLSISFYHAGSRRFYGDTFMGDGLDEDDDSRVESSSERWRARSRSGAHKVSILSVAMCTVIINHVLAVFSKMRIYHGIQFLVHSSTLSVENISCY